MTDRASFVLEIRLLGKFSAHIGGKPIKVLGSRVGNFLFAYLTLNHTEPVKRAFLAQLLWPESAYKSAMDNLRHCLVDLRKALGIEAGRMSPPSSPTLSLDLTGAYVDVYEFERLISSDNYNDLLHGIRVYSGRLLSECDGDWAELERERLQGLFQTGLGRLAGHPETAAVPGAALQALTRAYAADQTNESVGCALMKAQAAVGNFVAVGETYSMLRMRLRKAFNTGPSPDTVAAYKQIRCSQREEEANRNRTVGFGIADDNQIGSVPLPLTRLVGRDDALLDVQASLDASRMVTLVGIGGIGKTQLAIAVARASRAEYAEGAWFVELSSLRHASQIAHEILSVFHETTADADAETALLRILADRNLLLVLDNCEHLTPGCSRLISGMLAKCSNLRILATSRLSLHVPGETVWQVPKLSLPRIRRLSEAGDVRAVKYSSTALSAIMDYGGIRLFADRAAQARQMFAVSPVNISGVIEICRRMDGIPLAIELAAAWVRSLTVEQICVRLKNHFDLLKSRNTAMPLRHRTLLAAVDWSYNLLPKQEQNLWRQISVFPDGFTLEAAEAVFALPQADPQLLEVLTGLIDASVLAYSEQDGEGRYLLPETLRQYCFTLQDWSECEHADLRARYVQYFASMCETATPNLSGSDQAAWLDKIDRDRGNLRVAFEYAANMGNGADGLRMAAAVWRYYYIRGYYAEGYKTIVRMLECGTNVEAVTRASAEAAAGNLAFHSGEHLKAQAHFESSLSLCTRISNKSGRARSLASLALIANAQGNHAQARELLEESHGLFIEVGDSRSLSAVLGNLAITACYLEDFSSAYRFHEDSIQLFRETGDMQRVGMALANLAGLYISQGDYNPVLPMVIEALEISRIQDSAAILGHCLVIALSVAIRYSKFEVAAVCAGADKTLRLAFYLPLPDDMKEEQAMLLARIKEELEPCDFQSLYEQGEMMNHDEVVTYLTSAFISL